MSLGLTRSTALLLLILGLALVTAITWIWVLRRRMERQRRQGEAELHETRARLIRFSDELPIAAFTFHPETGFVDVSENIINLLGVPKGTLMNEPSILLDRLHPNDIESLNWAVGASEIPARLDWLGRTNPYQSPQRWLRINAAIDLARDGAQVLSGFFIDVTPLKVAQQEAELSREEIRQLAEHRENARENQYRHLAREFHDELGQIITSARLRLKLMAQELGSSAKPSVDEIDAMLVEAYRSIKAIAAELRPPALNLGITAAIEWQAERTLANAGIKYTLAIRPEANQLAEKTMITLFRIVQESLTNIARYAQAKNVHISLRCEDDAFRLEIADDGRGFELDKIDRRSHFGIAGMYERITALRGTLEIDSALNEGTRICATVPLTGEELS